MYTKKRKNFIVEYQRLAHAMGAKLTLGRRFLDVRSRFLCLLFRAKGDIPVGGEFVRFDGERTSLGSFAIHIASFPFHLNRPQMLKIVKAALRTIIAG